MNEEWSLSGKYNPHQVEEKVLRFWDEIKLYEMIKARNALGKMQFNFVDGPPYPSGDVPHLGTAWNKILKDMVLRYWRMKNYKVFDKPGYDCHGLPIEVKVEQKLGIRTKREIEEKIGIERFIEECKKLALTNLQAMTKWFKELGILMDWDDPYLTLRDQYIEAEWWLVKRADELGLLEQEQRVVYWCPRCSTTLAEYEVEYHELEDPSIYVKLRVKGLEDTYLVIWTTTPWTLPANMFVMINPNEPYVKVKVGNETWILAKQRIYSVMKECNIDRYEILEELPGSELIGYAYEHPLEDLVPLQRELSKYHVAYPAPEYVSMYEGSGIVHAAPGHGFEDFEIAKRYRIDLIACPVDEEGKFTKETGKYSGMYVRDANEHIISDLRERKALIWAGSIKHKYPVCWRCKTPVILRATTQWIIRISKLKNKIAEEVRKVDWIPPWALDRIMNMIENLQDWVISRQRYWGTPLPIWLCPNGHKVVIGRSSELEKLGGFKPRELHRPWIDQVVLKCPICGHQMRRVPDVMDVWFDSGVAFYASKGHPDELGSSDIVMDFITEGHDQTRGWFFSLLRAGVLGFNIAPYKVVLVHGFMLDEQGREMHKSLGNYVGTDEAISAIGRDPLRLWLASNTVWEDAKFSWRELKETIRDLDILWNTAVFAHTYMSLDNFNAENYALKDYVNYLRPEDRWIMSRINALISKVDKYMSRYEIHEAVRSIREFFVEDLSHWYIRIVRPRVWVEENVPDKIVVYIVLHYILDRLVRLLALVTPFIAEYIYQAMLRKYHSEYSVNLLQLPEVDEQFIDTELENKMMVVREIYQATSRARSKLRLKLRQPIKRLLVYTDDQLVIDAITSLIEVIRQITNAKEVSVMRTAMISDIIRYKAEPLHRVIGPKYRDLAKSVIEYIERNSESIARDILEKGVHRFVIDGEEITLTRNEVNIVPYYMEGYSVEECKWGAVAIDTRLGPDEIAEGLARDIVRRIQVMRKIMNLSLMAKIITLIVAPEDKLELVDKMKNYIAEETRSSKIILTKDKNMAGTLGGLVETWEIDGDEYIIEIKEV
ncbi:MAG: isoleucine--tRNA ligase [Desulfurococcaceae archaeon]